MSDLTGKSLPSRPVFWLLGCAMALSGCGKIGDPLPPIPRAPLVIEELKVEQQGARLALSFPLVRTQRSAPLGRIDIYRLVESAGDPAGLPQETFASSASLIQSIPGDRIPRKSSTVTYIDPLEMKNTGPARRYRYAIRLVSASGVAADFSNYAVIEPLFDLSLPPTNIRFAQAERETVIEWDVPVANENGSKPANAAAYYIYRRIGADGQLIRLNQEPIREPRFADRNFQFGTAYQYIVRALSPQPGNAALTSAIESNDSAPAAHTPKDTFPPAAPSSVTVASINSIVSLFWPLNSEPDVAGYNIYRSDDEKAPPERWIRLNQQLHKTASFRDEKVQAGKQYFYQITAVDQFGNESARSATVSETVNP